MPQLLATIDVGTNTAHLLLAYALADGSIVPIRTETRYVRLGQGVDGSGELHPDAQERLRSTLVDFAEIARNAGAAPILAAGTSASRDIRDGDGLVRFVREHAGIEYNIISGEDEALLTTLGTVSCLDLDSEARIVVADIGGGSTELTFTHRREGPISLMALTSLNIGSVRLTERCFSRLPPTEDEIQHAERLVRESLDKARRPDNGEWTMVGAAGTIRALALLSAEPDSAAGPTVLTRGLVGVWRERLLGLDYGQTLALNPEVLRGRADVIAAGVLILDIIFDFLGAAECIVSPWGLRHGMAIRYARRQAGIDT